MINQSVRLALVCAFLGAGQSDAAVRFVNPRHAAAVDAGAGTSAQPYRTLTFAMKQLRPGDTLNIAAGTYRESLMFPVLDWSTGTTVIRPASGEVLIKGSDIVTGWTVVSPGVYVKRGWTVNSQQVFVNGVALKQIGGTIYGDFPADPNHPLAKLHPTNGGIWPGRTPGGLAQLVNNSFYYNAAGDSLYIKIPQTTLTGLTVEVSVRPRLVFGEQLRNITLKNLRFQHSNTTALNQSGALTLLGSRLVLDTITVTHCDGAGFDIQGDENIIRNCKVNYCGQVGIKARGRGYQVVNNETSFNNARGFNKYWEAGGAKFVGAGGLRDSEVTGHRALRNNGDGIWFDWNNNNNKIHNNLSAYNSGFGIHYEASQRGYIYDNYVFSNGQRGIYLNDSADSVVAYNFVADHPLEGIVIMEDARARTTPAFVPLRNRVIGNIIGWSTRPAIVLPPGLRENASDYNVVIAWGPSPMFSIGWSPLYTGLTAWRPASGQDAHSWGRQVQIPPATFAQLQADDPAADWSAILTAAAIYRTDPTAVGATALAIMGNHSVPGPRR